MRWIRNLEDVATAPKRYVVEYELGSECDIPGLLDYEDGAVICAPMPSPRPLKGLWLYNLILTFPDTPPKHNLKADEKGYYFREGVVGELIALMALFFRARFFLVSSRVPATNPRIAATIKITHSFVRMTCDAAVHPPLFQSDKKNFATGFDVFLNSVRGLEPKRHQRFILACHHYSRGIKEVGVDPEMVYIRLVSAIESLSKDIALTRKDDILEEKRVATLIQESDFSTEEKQELRSIFEVRKSRKRFVAFVQQHCAGFFKGGNWRARHLKVRKGSLPKILDTIYKARSSYLHSGEPMFLSGIATRQKWDMDPTAEMIIDNRRLPGSAKLPYAHFFEGLVRHCLLNYVKANASIPAAQTNASVPPGAQKLMRTGIR
ncbi:MAG: hypothetical protein ABSD98_15275 [Candidatus Korobacteraceae bacterium]|jgi:hypothetical protein